MFVGYILSRIRLRCSASPLEPLYLLHVCSTWPLKLMESSAYTCNLFLFCLPSNWKYQSFPLLSCFHGGVWNVRIITFYWFLVHILVTYSYFVCHQTGSINLSHCCHVFMGVSEMFVSSLSIDSSIYIRRKLGFVLVTSVQSTLYANNWYTMPLRLTCLLV